LCKQKQKDMRTILFSTIELMVYLVVRVTILIGSILLVINLVSCSPKNVPNISRPSKREINKAMKYSTWKYKQPKMCHSVCNGY
jgi:hypothetical protein